MWDDKWTGETIGAALDEAAERYGDKVATVFQQRRSDLPTSSSERRISSPGAFLAWASAKAIKSPSGWRGYAEWAYAYFALARIGADHGAGQYPLPA